MVKKLLTTGWTFAFISIGCNNGPGPIENKPQEGQEFTISSPRSDYLLGEPVLLNFTFRNTSAHPLVIIGWFVEQNYCEIPIFIAKQGRPPQEFDLGKTQCRFLRPQHKLDPKDTLVYKFRVLQDDSGPAFNGSGKYTIKAVYTLWLPEVANHRRIESNDLHISIRQPRGEDAEVYKILKDDACVILLQTESLDDKRKDVPLKMAELLCTYPNTGYGPALRHALAKIYFHHRIGLAEKDANRLGSILGISEVRFFQDKRLAARRKVPFDTTKLTPKEAWEKLEEKRPIREILRILSESSGVNLQGSNEIQSKKTKLFGFYVSECMQFLSDDLEATWERLGEGYVLVPFKTVPDKQTGKKGKKLNGYNIGEKKGDPSRNRPVKVTGQVLLDGQPMADGEISFRQAHSTKDEGSRHEANGPGMVLFHGQAAIYVTDNRGQGIGKRLTCRHPAQGSQG